MKKVLIIGRPNVGKSSLFNRLIKKRKALVLNFPGVTRDILKAQTRWWGREFEVWDSGGWIQNSKSSIFSSVKKFIEKAIQKVDLIIFVMDAHTGLHDEDKMIFKLIKNKKYLLVVNKMDHYKNDQVSEFWKLGSPFITSSFEKNENIHQIVEWIFKNTEKKEEQTKEKKISILVTGQPNVGKSSLCNKILKANRMITSPTAHTTVDVVDEFFKFEGKIYNLLDTTGMRKKSRRLNDLEKLAVARTLKIFKKIDFILLVVDSQKGFSRQDIRILSYCMDQYKSVMLIINKWDLMKEHSKLKWKKKIEESLPFFSDLPLVFVSAKTGLGVHLLMKKVDELIQKIRLSIPTSQLNDFFSQTIQKAPPPLYGTKNIKFYYLTQVKTAPPGFIVFANEPKGVSSSYKKFLIKKIQNKWSLKGIPIEINFVQKR